MFGQIIYRPCVDWSLTYLDFRERHETEFNYLTQVLLYYNFIYLKQL